MTPLLDKYDFGMGWHSIINVFYLFLNYFGHIKNKSTSDYFVINYSTLLVISILIVYTLMVQDTKYASIIIPRLCKINITLISLENVLIYETDPRYTIHPNRCQYTLIYDQSSLYKIILESTTLMTIVVQEIVLSLGREVVISSRIVDVTLLRLNSIHKLTSAVAETH